MTGQGRVMTEGSPSWIPRAEALQRLGVKTQTLYAYVSRGRISARTDPSDPRRSLYSAQDVARLKDPSTAGAPIQLEGHRPARARDQVGVESALTSVQDGRLTYRGRDAAVLAETWTLEQTAALLWGAEEDERPFADQKPRVDVVFPGGVRARLLAALARRADEDSASPGRGDRSLRREAAAIVNEMVDVVAGAGPRLYIHQRLARGWKLNERDADLVRRALVLSADDGLDAAALAARVASGAGAPLSASALAAMGAMTGPMLGGGLAQTAAWVAEARRGDPREAVRHSLAQGRDVPGFGHPHFPDGDPRAAALLNAANLPGDLLEILRVGEAMTGRRANLDLALALVARRLEMPKDGAFALMALGRIAGWLAHAMEQARAGSPIQARLRYVGP
ncbi:citrate/2-methylcitrate synthase [Brevundimonas sp. 2R-24]|uniref:Citrate/2-methylcitrate synthase n=1 Tax=Peiella sedimenti TaxID=3061083 RepID=A0ABT8SH47_9CAUL|nr:citrate/2-methylcitrate synthase [Caulobacteraceae bacterium XZ-24]